jgi:hypothetical protein
MSYLLSHDHDMLYRINYFTNIILDITTNILILSPINAIIRITLSNFSKNLAFKVISEES